MLNVEKSAVLLDAMANPQRLAVLRILAQGELCVGDLQAEIGLSQSALSQHLAKLRARNFVKTRRVAQTIYYRCESPAVHAILQTLEDIAS